MSEVIHFDVKIQKIAKFKPEDNYYFVLVSGNYFDEGSKTTKYIEYYKCSINNSPFKLMEGLDYDIYGILGSSNTIVAKNINVKVPLTNQAIIAFVKKNAKKFDIGKPVGEKTIERIVEKIGNKEFWKVLKEKTVEELTEMVDNKAIKTDHFLRLKAMHNEFYSSADVMMTLTEKYAIRSDIAANLIKKIGHEKILQIVQDKPYSLCRYKGVGFRSIDKVALMNGYSEKSLERITEGIVYVLELNEQRGHCFIYNEGSDGVTNTLIDELGYADNILTKLRKDKPDEDFELLLTSEEYNTEVNEYKDLIKKSLENLENEEYSRIKTRTVFRDNNKTGGKYQTKQYYLKEMYYNELYIADKLSKMAKTKLNVNISVIKKIISDLEQQNKFTLSDEQKNGIIMALQNRVIVLTGAAGVGKTSSTKFLVETIKRFKDYNNEKIEFILCAPTGMAAKRMSDVIGMKAKTVHSTLGYNGIGKFVKGEEEQLECDELINDEVSMEGVHMVSSILKALPEKSRIVFIGDPNQLPSIEAGNVLSDLIESNVIPTIKLTKVFRQSDEKKLIQYAHEVLMGRTPTIPSVFNKEKQNLFQLGYDTVFIERDKLEEYGIDHEKFFIDLIKNKIPKYYKDKPIQILSPQKTKGKLSSVEISKLVQGAINPPSKNKEEHKVKKSNFEYTLREGDKVINVMNDNVIWEKSEKEFRINNGEIGTLEKIFLENGKKFAVVKFQGTRFQFRQNQLKNLELAYAVSIHKCLSGESTVYIKNKGLIKLKDVNIGDYIITSNEKYNKVTNKWNTGEKETYEVDIKDYGSLYSTKEHKFLVHDINTGIEKFIELQYIDKYKHKLINQFGDKVIINNISNESKIEQTFDIEVEDVHRFICEGVVVSNSQGSEFPIVVICVDNSTYYELLQRGLIYTALTRGKDLVVLYGDRKALHRAVQNNKVEKRRTYLKELLNMKK